MRIFSRPTFAAATILIVTASARPAVAANSTTDRLAAAAMSLEEVMGTPDKGIPEDLMKKAECAVIVPGVKEGAFVVGAKYGRGFLSCRTAPGAWSAPAGVRIEGGSVGFQIGGNETDVFLLVLNEHGVDKLLSSQFTLGGDAKVAAGPVGRRTSAETDAQMRAEMLSWSRARGVFAGVAINGATLREDEDANRDMYGRALTNREIVKGSVQPPASAARLMALLRRY